MPVTPITGYIFSTKTEKPKPENITTTSVNAIFCKTLVFPFVRENAEYNDETRVVTIEKKVIANAITDDTASFATAFINGISPLLPTTQRDIRSIETNRKKDTEKATMIFPRAFKPLDESTIIVDESKQFIPV